MAGRLGLLRRNNTSGDGAWMNWEHISSFRESV
jgi:hypothetical protein